MDSISVNWYKSLDHLPSQKKTDQLKACGNCYMKWFLKKEETVTVKGGITCPFSNMQMKKEACDICDKKLFICQLIEHHEEGRKELNKVPVKAVFKNGDVSPEKKPDEEEIDEHLQMKPEEEENNNEPVQVMPEEEEEEDNNAPHQVVPLRRGCPWKPFGCKFVGTEEDIDRHMINSCQGKRLSMFNDFAELQRKIYHSNLSLFPVPRIS